MLFYSWIPDQVGEDILQQKFSKQIECSFSSTFLDVMNFRIGSNKKMRPQSAGAFFIQEQFLKKRAIYCARLS